MRKCRIGCGTLILIIIVYWMLLTFRDALYLHQTYTNSPSKFVGKGFHGSCAVQQKFGKKWGAFIAVLHKYKRFHQLELRKNNTLASGRTLVWACEGACSGMAARIRGLEQVFLLALMTNRVYGIRLDETSRKAMMLYIKPNLIDWYSLFNSSTYNHGAYVTVKSMSSSCNTTLLAYILHSNTAHITISSQVGNMLQDCKEHLKNEFRKLSLNWNTDSEERGVLSGILHQFLFRFSASFLSDVDDATQVLGLRGQRYVGLHMRTGFEGLSIQETVPTLGSKILQERTLWESSVKCAIRVADNSIGLGTPIFLATDSYNVKSWALQHYGERIRTLQNITIIHPDKKKSWTHAENEYLGLWMDIVLLARSYLLIRPSSGFSAFASELCLIPPSSVYKIPTCTQMLYM